MIKLSNRNSFFNMEDPLVLTALCVIFQYVLFCFLCIVIIVPLIKYFDYDYFNYTLFAYIGFIFLTNYYLFKYNDKVINKLPLKHRLKKNFIYLLVPYIIFIGLFYAFMYAIDTDLYYIEIVFYVLFFEQLAVCTYLSNRFIYERKYEFKDELERLRKCYLLKRCTAVTKKLDPLFFLVPLNSLSSLMKKESEEDNYHFFEKMVNMMRYIMDSEEDKLINLRDELSFAHSYVCVRGSRGLWKIPCQIYVSISYYTRKLPMMTLMPLLNIMIYCNKIDDKHRTILRIIVNQSEELVVSFALYLKLDKEEEKENSLNDLQSRFEKMMKKKIRTETKGDIFSVYIPLNKEEEENPIVDCPKET